MMGDYQQELEAGVKLTCYLADRHYDADAHGPDLQYARALILSAPDLLSAAKSVLQLHKIGTYKGGDVMGSMTMDPLGQLYKAIQKAESFANGREG